MKKYLVILGALLIIISCKKAIPWEENIFFETPQPINDSELSKIPNRFRGLYVDTDSTYLRINENIILSEINREYRIHKTKMDSLKQEFVFVDGKYLCKLDHKKYDFKTIGDSIALLTKDIDTVFIFSNTQKAKLLHGQIILNTKDSIFWTAKILSLSKTTISLKHLYSKMDLKRMDSITKVKATMFDSTAYILKPSRREFIKFIGLKHFGFDQEYRKISK